jgi:hypothetical protein
MVRGAGPPEADGPVGLPRHPRPPRPAPLGRRPADRRIAFHLQAWVAEQRASGAAPVRDAATAPGARDHGRLPPGRARSRLLRIAVGGAVALRVGRVDLDPAADRRRGVRRRGRRASRPGCPQGVRAPVGARPRLPRRRAAPAPGRPRPDELVFTALRGGGVLRNRMLGHASAALTLDTYTDLVDDDLDAVAERSDLAARAVRDGLADSLRTPGPCAAPRRSSKGGASRRPALMRCPRQDSNLRTRLRRAGRREMTVPGWCRLRCIRAGQRPEWWLGTNGRDRPQLDLVLPQRCPRLSLASLSTEGRFHSCRSGVGVFVVSLSDGRPRSAPHRRDMAARLRASTRSVANSPFPTARAFVASS